VAKQCETEFWVYIPVYHDRHAVICRTGGELNHRSCVHTKRNTRNVKMYYAVVVSGPKPLSDAALQCFSASSVHFSN